MNLKPTEARVKQAWRRVPRVGAVDVLRTWLLVDVSAGDKKITTYKVYGCPSDIPGTSTKTLT
jgi:hypothetical protein